MITEQQKAKSAFPYLKWLLLLLIGAIIYLNYAGYLEPAVKFLDSPELTFKIGKVRVSLYEIIISSIGIVGVLWLADIISTFGESRIKRLRGINNANKAIISKFYQIFVYFLAFFIGLSALGIDLSVLAVFGGALGIGIGFGLQKVTSNFISGLILLFEKSIVTDDLIELTDGTTGLVKQIRARFTLLETPDGKEVLIPNEDLVTGKVINWTYTHKKARVEIKVGISYDDDVELAQKLMTDAAKEFPRCFHEPEPICYVREFADNSISLLMFFWVADVTEGRYGPKSSVMISILKKFKEAGIHIPYPQRDIYIKEQPKT